MIFHLPYSWLKEYVWVPKNPHELARQLSLYGPSVERVEAVRHEFTKVVIGEIISIARHPKADKLQVAMVRDGSGAPLRIVCGAPNIKVGQKVPLALVGATLPGGIRVGRREVRGVTSEGMLCSARELGIHDDHLGILILHPESKIGAHLSDLGNLNDYILEVEPTTNRPDISSVIGVAREVSAITGKPLKHLARQGESKKVYSCPLIVKVLNRKLCSRFMAVLIKDVSVGASPWWMQERLARAGIRPINSVVDITNYVLLEYCQPLHAFDADKLGNTIIVREAGQGETILALDGRTYHLKSNHLVVADAKKPVSIAGVMGGEATAVTADTVNVVLECANFDPVSIRRTSRELQLFSDSSRLFEKGLSEESPTLALSRAIELVHKICGGNHSAIADIRAKRYRSVIVKFPLSHLSKVLGLSIPPPTIKRLLKRLGFSVLGQRATLRVTVPYWRDHDVSAPEDLVEEVARLYGYHKFTPLLPEISAFNLVSRLQRTSKKTPYEKSRLSKRGVTGLTLVDELDDFFQEDKLRHSLAAMGFTEALSYSFVRESWLKAMAYPSSRALKISNPLTNDLVFLRPSLLPSLAAMVEANLAHREEIKIFEIGKIYLPGKNYGRGLEHYREEPVFLGGVITRTGTTAEELYRLVKGVVESLYYKNVNSRGVIQEEPVKSRPPFADGLSAVLRQTNVRNGGAFGILDSVFLQSFGVNQVVVAFELPLSLFMKSYSHPAYRPPPKFPAVKRDISLAISPNVRYTDLVKIMKSSTPLLESVDLFDIYYDEKLGDSMYSCAMHLIYRASDRTLSAAEVEQAEATMINLLKLKFGVTPR